jgi:hypothetical protein
MKIHTDFHNGCTGSHSHQQCVKAPPTLCPHQQLFVFLIDGQVTLAGVAWNPCCWICISSVVKEVGHVFVCSFALCTSGHSLIILLCLIFRALYIFSISVHPLKSWKIFHSVVVSADVQKLFTAMQSHFSVLTPGQLESSLENDCLSTPSRVVPLCFPVVVPEFQVSSELTFIQGER